MTFGTTASRLLKHFWGEVIMNELLMIFILGSVKTRDSVMLWQLLSTSITSDPTRSFTFPRGKSKIDT